MSEELNSEEKQRFERWMYTAAAIGYNELAKNAQELDEKVFFRLMRDNASTRLIELGGQANLFTHEDELFSLEVPDVMPRIRFRESDIEAMRKAVAEFDRSQGVP